LGFALKRELSAYAETLHHTVIDAGPFNEERTDYPVYAKLAAEKILRGEADRGIFICGTGCGIGLAANKIKGIRCCNCSEPYTSEMSRRHNDCNVLAIGARVVGNELAKTIVKAWLEAEFEGGRHAERLAMFE
jgi:ribose 5-phosphate isomerase B